MFIYFCLKSNDSIKGGVSIVSAHQKETCYIDIIHITISHKIEKISIFVSRNRLNAPHSLKQLLIFYHNNMLPSFSQEEIHTHRQRIRNILIEESKNIHDGNIQRISTHDLQILFRVYDLLFFNGFFAQNIPDKIRFSLSAKLTKVAGKTIMYKIGGHTSYEIRISSALLFRVEDAKRQLTVCGIEVNDALHSLLLVFEHEMMHLYLMCIQAESSCKKPTFQRQATTLFGHLAFTHALPSNLEHAENVYGLSAGAKVAFQYEGQEQIGTLYKVNKRAVVMVPNPNGMYQNKKGERFVKFYVPLQALQLVQA